MKIYILFFVCVLVYKKKTFWWTLLQELNWSNPTGLQLSKTSFLTHSYPWDVRNNKHCETIVSLFFINVHETKDISYHLMFYCIALGHCLMTTYYQYIASSGRKKTWLVQVLKDTQAITALSFRSDPPTKYSIILNA